MRNLADKLLDDVHGLCDLGTTHLAAGIAVAIASNDRLKRGQIRIGTVAKHAHVVVHARGATERADHRQVKRVLLADHTHAMQALAAAVVVQKRMHQGLVVGTHGIERLHNTRQLRVLNIVLKAADLVNRKDHSAAASALEDLENLLAQGPRTIEQRLEAKSIGEQAQPQQVRVNARKLVQNGADVLHAAGHLDVEHALAGAGIAAAVAHGADAADALGDVAKLVHVTLFGELLESAVHKADLRNCLDDAVVLDHQVQMKRLGQHRVLRAKRNNGAMCHGPYASFFCLSRAALAASAARTLAAFSESMAASFASISAALSAALAAASSC